MTFEEAFQALREGKPIYRRSWMTYEPLHSIEVRENTLYGNEQEITEEDLAADDWSYSTEEDI